MKTKTKKSTKIKTEFSAIETISPNMVRATPATPNINSESGVQARPTEAAIRPLKRPLLIYDNLLMYDNQADEADVEQLEPRSDEEIEEDFELKSAESCSAIIKKKRRQTTIDRRSVMELKEFKHETLSKFFKILDMKEDGKLMMQCLFENGTLERSSLCNRTFSIKYGSYGNLTKHLKTVHKTDSLSQTSQLPTPSPLAVVSKTYCSSRHIKQLKFDEGIVNMIALDGMPFNFVNGIAFKSFILDMDPHIVLKARSTYMKQLNTLFEKEIIPALQLEIANIEKRRCNFSCDIWSWRHREGILGVNIHYINENWKFITKVIAVRKILGHHTSENINNIFLETVSEFNFQEGWGGVIVTDNASNMKKAFRLAGVVELDDDLLSSEGENNIEEKDEIENDDDSRSIEGSETSEISDLDSLYEDDESDNPPQPFVSGHLTCLTHTIQLSINDEIKADKAAAEVISYVNSIIVFFRKSTLWSNELKKACKYDVCLPGRTRWIANLDMMGCFNQEGFFLAIRQILKVAHVEAGEKNKKPPPESPTVLFLQKSKELWTILRPVADATDKLQSDGTTSNLVILAMASTFKRLHSLKLNYFSAFTIRLLGNLKARFDPILREEEYCMATLLDPRQKTKIFSLPALCNSAENLVIPTKDQMVELLRFEYDLERVKMKKCSPIEQTDELIVEVEVPYAPSCNANLNSMFDLLRDVPWHPLPFRDEVHAYLGDETAAEDVDCLEYWKAHAHNLPVLSSLAMKYLAIPASSASIKRIFWLAGAIGRAKRAKVSAANIEKIILTRQYREKSVRAKLERHSRRERK